MPTDSMVFAILSPIFSSVFAFEWSSWGYFFSVADFSVDIHKGHLKRGVIVIFFYFLPMSIFLLFGFLVLVPGGVGEFGFCGLS